MPDDGETLAVAAHELRTPLSTLNATVELLAEHPQLASDELHELVMRLRRGVTWMNGLVENLDTWSAICNNQLTIHRESIPVLAGIEPAIAVTQTLLERRSQRTRLICPTPAPHVFGDAHRLGQVVANLLTNASRYSTCGDEIQIRVATEGAWVRVTVSDHGPGIAAEDRRRIFQRFERGREASDTVSEGRGLGLHIVSRIVELHGGAVGVDSLPGHGAAFWFTLRRDLERGCER
jgi:signal transduction histidine kinase